MSFQGPNRKYIQKKIQKVLEKYVLWPAKKLKLEYTKPKCFKCQVVVNCKTCIQGHKCDPYKIPK